MDIDMEIDRLVIDGPPLDAAGRAALHRALTTELARLMAGPAAWAPAAEAAVRAPDMAGTDRAAGLGRQLARAIYEGIRP